MAYEPPVSTVKVGDIFTDELIAKINEVLKDLNDITNSEDRIAINAEINVIDNSSNIGFFIFNFDNRNTGSQTPLRTLYYYYTFSQYVMNNNSKFKINLNENFQITADTIFI